jgi:hypothetical protein
MPIKAEGLKRKRDASSQPRAVVPYPYRRLLDAEIRLLRVLPSNPQGGIRCELDQLPLTGNLNYDALSYAWGNPSEDARTVLLDGILFQVTASLYQALAQFQSLPERSYADRYIWIDAICINQADAEEKSKQVMRMADIYSSARQVVVWLGPNPRHLDLHVKDLFSLMNSMDTKTWTVSDTEVALIHSLPPESVHRYLEAAKHVHDRPWTFRIWVVQEACLSKEPPVMYAGRHHTTLTHYAKAYDVLNASCQDYEMSRHSLSAKVIVSIRIRIQLELRLLEVYRNQTEVDASGETLSVDKPLPGALLPKPAGIPQLPDGYRSAADFLVDLLTRTTDRDSSVPHDRVYGLLGLAGIMKSNPLPSALTADYRLPFSKVCHQYASALIQATKDLRLMVCVHRDISGVPSWVPDFRYLELGVQKKDHGIRAEVSADGASLSVYGVVIGTCHSSLGGWDMADEDLDAGMLRRKSHLERRIIEFSAALRGVPPALVRDELLESMLRADRDTTRGAWQAVFASITNGDLDLADQQLIAPVATMMRMPYVVLENGTIDVLRCRSASPGVGDLLCLVKGLSDPALIRPHDDEYEFISTCYRVRNSTHENYNSGDDRAAFLASHETKRFTLI